MATLGVLLGAGIFGKDKAFGKKPKVPELPAIDLAKVQQGTVTDNIAALPGIQQLASGVNAFNQAEILKALEFALPGGLGQAQSLVRGQMAGELSPDVSAQVLRQSAVQAAQGGFGGSALGRNLGLRDLGLTSLQVQQQGISNFQTLAGLTQAPKFDVTSMFYSPQQRLAAAFQERSDQFNVQFMRNKISAAPDPFAAALTQAFIQDEKQIMELVGSVAGMATKAAG